MKPSRLDSTREVGRFDDIAENYTDIHDQSLGASGEGPEYFARYKIDCLRRLGIKRDMVVLDFGCGIGNLTRLLAQEFDTVHGYDPSQKSIETARQAGGKAQYRSDLGSDSGGHYHLVVLAGVLHHIPPENREETMRHVHGLLHPGGRVVVFEHNPLNPLTRRSVEACPFDEDAVLLPAREVTSLLSAAGFGERTQSYIVFFPHFLRRLRFLEPRLGFFPLGAQTLTVGTKR